MLLVMCPVCSAKLIYDATGRICFETSDSWVCYPVASDSVTYFLHGIALDEDTGIVFKQSKYFMKYSSLKMMPIEEKLIIRDSILRYHGRLLQSKGYFVTIDNAECLADSIIVEFTAQKNFLTCYVVIKYYIKDYICYSLSAMGSYETKEELMNTADTLTIDNIPFLQWIEE